MPDFDLQAYSASWQPVIDIDLEEILAEISASRQCPAELAAAMQQAVLGGGKRLRPLLVLAAARACGVDERRAVLAGCALELIHAYSLVHDDLPSMDDDDFRRGKPSCHKAFSEAMAILTGDALLTHAFDVLSRGVEAEQLQRAVGLISRAAGPLGMVAGQADDIRRVKQPLSVEEVEFNHARKTGAMFTAAVELGGVVARADDDQIKALSAYGRALGLAFQIVDDLLAHRGDQQSLGRPTGSDEANLRQTHPAIAGLENSRSRVKLLIEEAERELAIFGDPADALLGIADFVRQRA
ncbi:MAG: polyprenyl synthetase family protein [Deltaproteobacteria bacterium]|nr:polyprenyl synthetase family protein [Deltaproteobacteria bacterium]MBW1870876.1 polyprenyl synthetase family protein [Deltaproteobacteria bacterium]